MKAIKIGAIEYDIYEIADLRSSDDEKLNGHIKYEDIIRQDIFEGSLVHGCSIIKVEVTDELRSEI